VVFASLLCLGVSLQGGWVVWPLVLPGFFVMTFPMWTARNVLAPLGMVRLARWLGRTASWQWRLDFQGAGLVAAAMAVLRLPNAAPETIEPVEAAIRAQAPLLPGGVIAAALTAHARGDLGRARRLMMFCGWFPELRVPREAWRIARDWLVCDAVATGDWASAARLATEDGRPTSRRVRFLRAVAERMQGNVDAVSVAELGRLRRFTGAGLEPLFDRAVMATATPPEPPEEADPIHAGEDPLELALDLHARLLRTEKPRPADVRKLARRWDRVEGDPAFTPRIARRAGEIGARDPLGVRRRFLAEVREDLTHISVAAGLSAPGATEGVDVARDRAISAVEISATALKRRIGGERDLPPLDEVLEFIELTRLYAEAGKVGGVVTKRLVFRNLQDACTDQAVRLFNVRKERAIANAMFRFLAAEAKTVGDARAEELAKKNAACGC
jgi:hypothetical protein